MIKDAQFPKIKETDLRLMKEEFKFSPKGKMDFSKAKNGEKLVIKPKREVNVGTMPKKEVSMELKKASYPGKIKVVKDTFKGSLEY
jgi:hypothetical protein